jgi:hypothetical protein
MKPRATIFLFPLLLGLLLAGALFAPGAAQAYVCYQKIGDAACGGPTQGRCVQPDFCMCYEGWAGQECLNSVFCGITSCGTVAGDERPDKCLPAAGVCSALGFSGTCYCAPGRSGACCETIQFGALLAPVGLDFGGVPVGATAPAQAAFIFANPATIPLTLANIALSGANSADFAVVGGSCAPGSQVAAGGSCSITTAFTPAASGQRNALLTVTIGAANYPSASVFDTQVNAPLSTVVESNAVPFTSIFNIPNAFFISVDNGELLIHQNGAWTTLDTAPHSYAPHSLDPYMVKVRQTSSSSYNTSVTTRITPCPQVGVCATMNQFFKTTTIADPSQSPSATLSGIGTIAVGSIAIDPAAPATLYTAMDGAGIHKSTDSGVTWNPGAMQPANTRVKAVVIKPGDGTILYAATYGGGVYRSTNSGLNWSACASQPANQNIVSLTIDAAGKLYAGTEAGVFVSSDSCATWAERNTGLPN